MKIKLTNYLGLTKEFEIENFEEVESLLVVILSGDETLHVFYKDNTKRVLDSDNERMTSLFDGCYFLPLNKKDIEEWSNSKLNNESKFKLYSHKNR